MKSVTVKQIQELDRIAIEKIGVSSLALMESAGRSVAYEITKLLRRRKRNPLVCIVCGLGNNAGDGFVVARYLLNAGVNTKIFLIGKAKQLKHDAAVNYQVLRNLKYPIKEFQRIDGTIRNNIKKADVVVDAIFGVGLNREVRDPFKSVIEILNKEAKYIMAIDSPSGLGGTTGKIYGVCVKANKTVTFSFSKKGFHKACGPKHVGKVVVADIGIPAKLKARIVK